MDVKRIFRNLVTNKYMSNFDYMNYELSFRTVFYNSAITYCQCTCGFEHEYLDYILDSGEINEQIYDKLLHCIIDGECPHVHDVNSEYVKETGIIAMHIATAVGTVKAIKCSHPQVRNGKLFNLDPFETALFKGNVLIMSMPVVLRFSQTGRYRMIYAKRSSENTNKVEFEPLTHLEVCVRKTDIWLLKSYIKLHGLGNGIENAFHLTLKHNLLDMQDTLLLNEAWFTFHDYLHSLGLCCELAIVYDKPSILQKLLKNLQLRAGNLDIKNGDTVFHKAGYLLSRKKCQHILTTYGFSTPSNMTTFVRVNTLLILLHRYYDELKEEILQLLTSIPNLTDLLNLSIASKKWTSLHTYIIKGLRHPGALKTILDLGASVDIPDSQGRTPFTLLLYSSFIRPCSRQKAELLVFENPDAEANRSAIRHAMEMDSSMLKMQIRELRGSFLMDVQQHTLYGYNEPDDFALNFFAPFLIECGFTVPSDTATSMESWKTRLHPAEFAYLQRSLATPKSLLICCRNTLRRHFKGRQIHVFLDKSDIPESVKNFILLKPLLRCVSNQLLR